jgi:hypothetical protein
MHLLSDNNLIFSILDRSGRLPSTFNSDQVYSFLEEDSFSLVIYSSSGNEKGFLLFQIEDFSANIFQLNNILIWLQEKMETNRQKIFEEALLEVNLLIGTGGTQAMYYDAH